MSLRRAHFCILAIYGATFSGAHTQLAHTRKRTQVPVYLTCELLKGVHIPRLKVCLLLSPQALLTHGATLAPSGGGVHGPARARGGVLCAQTGLALLPR